MKALLNVCYPKDSSENSQNSSHWGAASKSLECHEDFERVEQLVNEVFKTRSSLILMAGNIYSMEWRNTLEAAPQCKED